MKPIILVCLLLAVFAFVFPIIIAVGNPLEAVDVATYPTTTAAQSTPVSIIVSDDAAETTAGPAVDAGITIKVLTGGQIVEMTIADYLVGVVAAEMPANFELEALKAQAVAARTYLLYKMLVSPSTAHPEADVCDDYTCCSAYATDEELKTRWGDSYDEYLEKIISAVTSVDGLYLCYDSEPILAVFHSSSNGMTESSASVWGQDLPYLQSVQSHENTDEIKNYISTVTVSLSDFQETISSAYPNADLSGDASSWIADYTYTDSGRLDTVTVGGVTIAGTELRSVFDLRSADIEIEIGADYIKFTTTGYGHGVGMSQYGANAMAEQGYTYDQILAQFYTGTELRSCAELFGTGAD